MQRKISATFTVEIEQLERLSKVASVRRINRSLIVRDAIERELERYAAEEQGTKVEAGERAERGGEAAEVALARRP